MVDQDRVGEHGPSLTMCMYQYRGYAPCIKNERNEGPKGSWAMDGHAGHDDSPHIYSFTSTMLGRKSFSSFAPSKRMASSISCCRTARQRAGRDGHRNAAL
jgi:hypothetical protein